MRKLSVIGIIVILSFAVYPHNEAHEEFPSYFSWRDVNGIDYTTSIKNQEPCPSCEAYALCAVLETLVQFEVGYPFGCDLSEAHLFFCSGGTCVWGVNVTHAAEYLKHIGVPDEGCFPDPRRESDMPCNYSLPGWENRTVKIMEWGWIDNDEEAIKSALMDYGPLVICIPVYEDFMYYNGGIYHHRWGDRVGGHLVTLVGYDDEHACWLIKNSWGDGWGEEGWIRVAYHEDIFLSPCYGGTGILYVDGVYETFMPDVPQVYIEEPQRYHTYLFNHEFPSLFDRLLVQVGIPRIIGWTTVKLTARNTNKVEFYLDGQLHHIDEEPPFEWILDADFGFHTIETLAYNAQNASKAIVDVFVIF